MTSSSWDVIIVGAGSAGLPAAIFAAKRGARVLQIEADGRVGGTLFWSSGQISAAGTRLQKSLGIEDSWQEHYEDVQRIAKNTVDPTLGRLAVQHASDTFEWLIDIGFKPAPETPLTSMGHEPYRTRRYYWGNNLAVSILEVIRPVHERLVAAGKIDLRLATKMVELLHEGGRVTGIVAEKNGVRETFRGQNVVLTTGGYAANPELWKELTPGYPLRSRCNPYSRGDGIRAARAIGAKVDGGDKLLCSFAGVLDNPNDPLSAMAAVVLAPQRRMPWEIFVNHVGKRFVREDHPSVDHREHALLKQKDTAMFVVFDEGIRQNAPAIDPVRGAQAVELFGNHPSYSKADTLAGLAQRLGVPAGNLEATVAKYNKAVDSQHDPEFGRLNLFRRIEKGPFYAIHAGGLSVVSPGGLNANERLQVVKNDGTPVPGLYAAGEILGFARLSGQAFVNGMSLTPALTFGRLLGERLLQWDGVARAAAE
ncbi:MAG: FAD-dependent oxidoreductase [Alphaproteobacteria bacterium]|nr:FAD-dependent oxidoreductase [Alphaproteobacteria bacterium]